MSFLLLSGIRLLASRFVLNANANASSSDEKRTFTTAGGLATIPSLELVMNRFLPGIRLPNLVGLADAAFNATMQPTSVIQYEAGKLLEKFMRSGGLRKEP